MSDHRKVLGVCKHTRHSNYTTTPLQQVLGVCKHVRATWGAVLSRKPIQIFPAEAQAQADWPPAADKRYICYERLLTGIGQLTEHCGDDTSHGWVGSAEKAITTVVLEACFLFSLHATAAPWPCTLGVATCQRLTTHLSPLMQPSHPPSPQPQLQ